MRIVISQRVFHPNTLGWADGLRAQGHDVRVLVVRHAIEAPNGSHPVVVVPNVAWLSRIGSRLSGRRITPTIPRPVKLWRELRRSRPDLVLIKNQGYRTIFISMMAAVLGARRLAWINRPDGLPGKWRWLARLGVMPRRCICTTADDVGALGHPSGSGELRYIPYAVPLPARVRPPRRGGPTRLLTVCSYDHERKRPWWTLEAAHVAGLLDGGAVFTFVGVGAPDAVGLRRLDELVLQLGCEDLVTVRRNVPFAEMSDIYAQHDVLVLPSRDEPFGMVVLEAMAHGLAVVVSSTVGARSCVRPGETGLVFDSFDIDELAASLRELVADPSRIDAMGIRGRALVEQAASPEGCAAAIAEFAGIRRPGAMRDAG